MIFCLKEVSPKIGKFDFWLMHESGKNVRIALCGSVNIKIRKKLIK